jgi:hypothetical protein
VEVVMMDGEGSGPLGLVGGEAPERARRSAAAMHTEEARRKAARTRKQSRDISGRLRELMDEEVQVKGKPVMTLRDLLASEFVTMARIQLRKGDGRLMLALWDRAYGKVPDRVAGHDGGPVQVEMFFSQAREFYGDREAIELEARVVDGGAA